MSGEQIKVEVSPTGATKVSVTGCPGPSCVSLTRAIEQSLGVVTSDKKTGDFFQTETQGVAQKAGQGG